MYYKMIMHKAGWLLNLILLGFYFLILEEDGVPLFEKS